MIGKSPAVLIAIIFCVFMVPKIAFGELQTLDETQLSNVYAEGFSNFTITDLGGGESEAKAWFNIYVDTYMEIDSLKLGYYDDAGHANAIPSTDWDENWENVQIGGDLNDPSQDWHAEGCYMKADFKNINAPNTRELKSITFGADSVTGDISANFVKFSGYIDDSNDNTPEYNGHRINLGLATISATTSEFSISLSLTGATTGYWVNFSQATVGP